MQEGRRGEGKGGKEGEGWEEPWNSRKRGQAVCFVDKLVCFIDKVVCFVDGVVCFVVCVSIHNETRAFDVVYAMLCVL